MVKQVRVLNDETGVVIRVGSPRGADFNQERKILGLFTVSDIIKVGSIWVAITVLVIGFDFRLKELEKGWPATIAAQAKIAEYVKHKDNFDSTFFGTEFENGRPTNPSWKPNNKGSLNQ